MVPLLTTRINGQLINYPATTSIIGDQNMEKWKIYGADANDQLKQNEERGSQLATDAFNKALDKG